MGPGDGIQIQRLMDLPTTLETADSPQQPGAAISANTQQQQQRAKALYATPPLGGANKLTPGGSRLPQHPGPPQRSISHNEVTFCVTLFALITSGFLWSLLLLINDVLLFFLAIIPSKSCDTFK